MLKILQLGHPLLRKVSQPVDNVSSPELQDLISEMLSTVKELHCSGLAAPQVGQSIRLFIFGDKDEERFVAINPLIHAHSLETDIAWERCLSIPNLYAKIPRYSQINVEYFDISGRKITRELANYESRIFQHELDHLNGLVYFDRIQNLKDIVTEQEYKERFAPKGG